MANKAFFLTSYFQYFFKQRQLPFSHAPFFLLHTPPQRLREWFCCEMGSLGVSDRYIDAFCIRTPKSVLARHYTDYNPERLQKIYEEANLKVLCDDAVFR